MRLRSSRSYLSILFENSLVWPNMAVTAEWICLRAVARCGCVDKFDMKIAIWYRAYGWIIQWLGEYVCPNEIFLLHFFFLRKSKPNESIILVNGVFFFGYSTMFQEATPNETSLFIWVPPKLWLQHNDLLIFLFHKLLIIAAPPHDIPINAKHTGKNIKYMT